MRFVRAVPWHGPVLSFVNESLEKYELFQKQARTEFDVELFSATSMMSVGVASWRLWKDVPMFTGVGSLSGMGETSMTGFLLALLIGVAMTAPAVILSFASFGRPRGLPDFPFWKRVVGGGLQ